MLHIDSPVEPYSEGVSVILYYLGRFCVSKRRETLTYAGIWQFPGGHVEAGETAMMAARRELIEETGLEVSGTRLVLLGRILITRADGGKYWGNRYGLEVMELEEVKNTEPEKHEDWKWVTPAELNKLKMIPKTKVYAFEFLRVLSQGGV